MRKTILFLLSTLLATFSALADPTAHSGVPHTRIVKIFACREARAATRAGTRTKSKKNSQPTDKVTTMPKDIATKSQEQAHP